MVQKRLFVAFGWTKRIPVKYLLNLTKTLEHNMSKHRSKRGLEIEMAGDKPVVNLAAGTRSSPCFQPSNHCSWNEKDIWQNDSRPVDLLRDSKGLYGIGIVYDDVLEENGRLKHLIFRPDVLRESTDFPSEYRAAVLQTLGDHRFIRSCYEWTLHEVMLDEALKRNPRYQEYAACSDLERERLCRKIKWGQHRRQLINLNGMLKRLIAEAAEPNALQLARRFHPAVREKIYRAAAISQRASQLIDAFPFLGIAIYSPPGNEGDDWWNKAPDAVKMVERGVRLNQIASFMDVPMWARKLKPAVADWFCYMPDDLHYYLPGKTWEQRLWLRAFKSRGNTDPDFAYWIARNVLKIGNRIRPVLDFLEEMHDWVKEAKRKKPRCISRPFSPDMSMETVRKENEVWHEAIANCKASKSDYNIPAPWYPAAQVNGYQIVPLDSTEELWKEGRAMHHCAGSYDYRVAAGQCYLYSVRKGDNRVGTVELVRKEGKVKLLQIRAACNAEPPREVKGAVRIVGFGPEGGVRDTDKLLRFFLSVLTSVHPPLCACSRLLLDHRD
jgi:PcfJ-like protein